MADAQGQYSQEELYDALRRADAAGDTDGAKKLSDYIATQGEAEPQPTPQNNSIARLPLMAGSAIAKGAVNLLGVPGDLQDLANSGMNLMTNPGPKELEAQRLARFPTSNELTSATTDKLGITNRPDLTPTTPLERYGSAALGAVPAAAATIATGGAALPAVAGSVLPALVGEGAHDLAPDSRWAPVVAGLATGLGVAGITGAVERAQSASNALRRVESAKGALAEARDAAFTGRKALSDSVDSIKATSAADFAATRETLTRARDAVHRTADEAIGKVAGLFGKSGTLQEAGTALQEQARGWLTKTLPKRLGDLWEPVNNAIPKDSRFSLSNFQHGLAEINSDAGELEPLAGSLKPSGPLTLGKKMEQVLDMKELSGAPDGFTWGNIQKLRTNLGDALSNPVTVKDIGAENLSKLYATLTADMERAARQSGVGSQFAAANEGSTRLYALAKGPMARLVASGKATAEDPAPEAVAKGLLAGGKAGASDLGALRAEIPKGVDELAAAHLRTSPGSWGKLAPETQVALDPEGSRGATVLSALASKAEAEAAHKGGFTLAQQQHQSNVDAARQAAKEGNFTHMARVRSSAEALAEAKAAHGALPKTSNPGVHSLQSLAGSTVGDHLAVAGLNALGFQGSDLVHGAVGALVGAAAPMIARGATNMLTQPQRLIYPALGAETGANALRPGQ